jgi:hypothetical protein
VFMEEHSVAAPGQRAEGGQDDGLHARLDYLAVGVRRDGPGLGPPPPARAPKEGSSAADHTAQPGARGCPVPRDDCAAGNYPMLSGLIVTGHDESFIRTPGRQQDSRSAAQCSDRGNRAVAYPLDARARLSASRILAAPAPPLGP